MSDDAEPRVRAAARALLAALPEGAGPVRVADAAGRLRCVILVWPAGGRVPAAGERRAGDRADCRRDILAALHEAGRPLTRKQVVKALRQRGTPHGLGTVAKALADLTAAGELVNRKDKRGYRRPDWPKPSATPSSADSPASDRWYSRCDRSAGVYPLSSRCC